MSITPTLQEIKKSKQNEHWDFGNQILYELCKKNFTHTKKEVILAKVLFIGRIYAAAVERRRNKNKSSEINDNFYIKTIGPAFKNSKLDFYLKKLKPIKKLSVDNLQEVLQVHYYLTSNLYKITNLEKRSFSSKYLHFHLPNLFFIYDRRAVTALRHLECKTPKNIERLIEYGKVDKEYASFFIKCFDFKNKIEYRYNTQLSTRQFDNILIEIANRKKLNNEKKYST